MNHDDVMLIGVGDPEGKQESFCYTVDAPTNLWIGALTESGSRMSIPFMASLLNSLIDGDCWLEGMTHREQDQSGVSLVATVGELVPAASVQANMAQTNMVRRVGVRLERDPGRVVDQDPQGDDRSAQASEP